MKFKSFFFSKYFFCQNMFKKLISILKLCPKSGLKHSVDHAQGIGMKFKYFFFSIFFWSKFGSKMTFLSKICRV